MRWEGISRETRIDVIQDRRRFRSRLHRRMSVLTLCAILLPSAAGCIALYLHARQGIRQQIARSEAEIREKGRAEVEFAKRSFESDLRDLVSVLAQATVDSSQTGDFSPLRKLADALRASERVRDLRVDLADGGRAVEPETDLGEDADEAEGAILYEIDRAGDVLGWIRLLPDRSAMEAHLAETQSALDRSLKEAYERASLREEQYLLFTVLVFLALAGCSISASTTFLRRYVIRRLGNLLETCRLMAERDYRARADEQGSDEISELAASFNWMARQVGQTHARLESQVRERTDELHRANADLRLALEEARQAAKAKGEFLAVMSHELRTPLNGVLGFAQLLEGTDLDAEQRECVEEIRHSGGLLINLINDILDFTKAGSGKLVVESAELDLDETVDHVVGVVFADAAAKQLDLRVEIAPDVPRRVRGDRLRIQQILLNLVGNAVKFTSEGRVEVRVENDVDTRLSEDGKHRIAFTVSDTGPGIPLDKQDVVFEPFMQADLSTTRRFGGTGLGLAICRTLTEIMGGEITLDSVEGEGSVFRFTVTVEALDSSEMRPSPRRALLITDTPGGRGALASRLRRSGVDVHEEPSESVAGIASDEKPDLVVLDLVPEALGEMVSRIRELSPRSPLVVVSSRGERSQGGSGDLAGVSLVLQPIRRRELDAVLDELDGAPGDRSDEEARTLSNEMGAAETRPKILLAEDNPVNRTVARRMLEKLGYEVVAAEDGVEAVKTFEQGGIDAIIMDCDMPRMDGFDATRAIRALPGSGSELPIIALTASAMPADKERCLASGMNEMLAKPVQLDVLGETLKALIDSDASRSNG